MCDIIFSSRRFVVVPQPESFSHSSIAIQLVPATSFCPPRDSIPRKSRWRSFLRRVVARTCVVAPGWYGKRFSGSVAIAQDGATDRRKRRRRNLLRAYPVLSPRVSAETGESPGDIQQCPAFRSFRPGRSSRRASTLSLQGARVAKTRRPTYWYGCFSGNRSEFCARDPPLQISLYRSVDPPARSTR